MKCPKCKIGDIIVNSDKAVCPNCGARFTVKRENNKEPNTSKDVKNEIQNNEPKTEPLTEQKQNNINQENFSQSEREKMQHEIERLKLEKEIATLRAEKSELEAKLLQIEREREQETESEGSEFSSKVKNFWYYHKNSIVAFLLIAIIIVSVITPCIMCIGVRGMYVNVDDPNEFISFMPLKYTRSYKGENVLTSEYEIEEGKYSKKGDEIVFKPKLTKEDKEIMDGFEMDASDLYETLSFKKESNDRIMVDGKTFVRISRKQYSQLVNQKISVKINDQNYILKAGKELDAGQSYNACLTWNSEQDGSGYTYHKNDKQWVSASYYKVTNHKFNDEGICSICGAEYSSNSSTPDTIVISEGQTIYWPLIVILLLVLILVIIAIVRVVRKKNNFRELE